VEKDYREAVGKSLRGTPSFFINGTPLVGAKDFSEFKKLLDQSLTAGSATPGK
jgi:protein-disulfide isomerase